MLFIQYCIIFGELKLVRLCGIFFIIQQIPAGKKFPLETEILEHPPISKVMLQGFDAQLTYDEITYVNITVCAHSKVHFFTTIDQKLVRIFVAKCRLPFHQ